MENTVTFTKEQIDWIRNNAKTVVTGQGTIYHFLPYWFEETSSPGKVKAHLVGDNLPEELVKAIETIRG